MPKRRLIKAFRASMPSRESLAENRFVKPVAHRVLAPELWRFTRRSVPRGVALGLLVGIFLLIPGLQIAGAALLALPFRANVPLAAAMTFLSNPATTPFILAASYYVGATMLGRSGDVSQVMALIHHEAGLAEWTAWLLSSTAPVLLFGLFVVSVVSAAIGYFVSSWLWKSRIGRKWRGRQAGRSESAETGGAGILPLGGQIS
ncbi:MULTISPECIES: DUF2062 domain-containing protein [unclassified Sphingobium]|uniref:DUF2062 domain-containing protein n=1 Tax=unclassified Sphingobium TaxID=2611147 RepID=UPI0022253C97|nr:MULTISPECIES: DUF2062 domain-containing protein [unclassified Sphingobium]MCW2412426.1 uncharacterized protein (DUF2062 family) [Sphingobium sp. B8D3D]MCW2415277.1 uncharacterized protein (DUF2062 family) [Sphingobium sp. B8D3A]